MEKKSGIYQIRNTINNKIYVGSAISLSDRKNLHFSQLRRKIHHSIILQRAYNKYGVGTFQFEVLEYVECKLLISREQHYIDTLNPSYNICKIAGSTLGRDSVRKLPVIQYSLNGKPVQEWESLQQVMKLFNLSNSSKISQCCKGMRNKAYGFVWRYKNSNLPFFISLKRKGKPITRVDESGEIQETWPRVKDCATQLGIRSSHICRVLNTDKKLNGFYFKR